MNLSHLIHERFLLGRRVRVLSDRIAAVLPADAGVLDVGSGDGQIAKRVMDLRPDVAIRGIDVLVRPETAIPVEQFNGADFPFEDDSFDTVIFVDVLHHTNDVTGLLSEAARVARTSVVLKDHVRSGWAAQSTLRLMDRVGNERHGVDLPFNYLTGDEWTEAFASSGLEVESWQGSLGIYVWPASLLFDRRLHFVASLSV